MFAPLLPLLLRPAPHLSESTGHNMTIYAWITNAYVQQTSFSDLNQAHDEVGILKSRSYVSSLVESEVKEHNISSDRIIVGGFSQGGAISVFTGLTIQRKLAGIFGLSCYLVLGNRIAEFVKEANNVNKDTPFFLAHGDSDPVVRYDWGKKTAQVVEKDLGHNVEFKTYRNLPHSAALEEIDDLEVWIRKCLTKQPAAESSSTTKTATAEVPEGQGSL